MGIWWQGIVANGKANFKFYLDLGLKEDLMFIGGCCQEMTLSFPFV